MLFKSLDLYVTWNVGWFKFFLYFKGFKSRQVPEKFKRRELSVPTAVFKVLHFKDYFFILYKYIRNMEAIETLVCLSHYFVNKQNVRSFGNIIKWNILNNLSDIEFCTLILKEEDLVSGVPIDFVQILSMLKSKLRNKCKNDFRDEFQHYFHINRVTYLQPVNKEYIFTNCWNTMCEIIPRNLFGGNQNFKILKNLVHSVIYSMRRQHFMLGNVVGKWDTAVLPWKDVPNSRKILFHLILWILKNILASIICLNFHVTTCKFDANENKLYYFWKNHWQSFYDKQISKLIYTKVLLKYEPYSLGKNSKRNLSFANRIKLRMLKKDTPKLHLTLKPNNECRPIVCYRNHQQNTIEKYKIKNRLRFLRSLVQQPATKIENLYHTMYAKWVNANKPKLYFIKTDLTNAFGSIKREKLAKILSAQYLTLLSAETCVYKKKIIAQQYKDIVSELRKPILIRTGSTVYKWKEGLVQGYKYSPALSELYYSYLDRTYFSNHLKTNEDCIKLFVRVVDDYLYITESIDDALSFLNALSNYRNVNYNKTLVNFPHDKIHYCQEINFLGYTYNTNTMQVGRASNIYAGQMCYKITFTSGVSNLGKFIESRISQSGIPINNHIFNLLYNDEELIWRHTFTTFCLSANKFCTILAVLCEEEEMKDFLLLYKKRVTVKLTISILEMLMRNKPTDIMFVYCINHFRYLSWKALNLCAKQTPKCSRLVPLIHDEMAKTNCIFGIWRQHASRIDANGDKQRKAYKEVCRRNDLRKIFRNFGALPPDFECYHHKRLK